MITRGRAVVELIAAALLFGIMAYLAKQTMHAVGGAQSAFVRFTVGALVCAGHFVAAGRPPRVVRKDLLAMRGLFGGLAVLLYFATMARLPVGTATLLNYTAPVFTATFAAIFLGEALPRLRVVAMVVAGAGVTLVVLGQGRALGGAYGWQLVGLASAVCSGVAVTSLRAARRTDGAWEVFTAFCVVGMACTAPFAFVDWRAPAGAMWLLLVTVGLVAAAAQVLMTHALGVVDAASAGIVGQLTVVTALGLGHFLDGEPFTGLSIVGAALTIVGVATATATDRASRNAMRLSRAPRRG